MPFSKKLKQNWNYQMNPLNIIKAKVLDLIKGAGTMLAFLFIYFKGKDAQKLHTLERQLKQREKENEIAEANLRKSDVAILNELRNKYSRKER